MGNNIFFTLLTFMAIYHAGVDIGLVGAGPGAGEAGVGLEAGAASVVGVLVVDGGGGFDTGGSGAAVMGSILPLKGRMTSAMTSSETDSLGL